MNKDLQFLVFLLTGTAIIVACACNNTTDTLVAGVCSPFFLWSTWEGMKK